MKERIQRDERVHVKEGRRRVQMGKEGRRRVQVGKRKKEASAGG